MQMNHGKIPSNVVVSLGTNRSNLSTCWNHTVVLPQSQ